MSKLPKVSTDSLKEELEEIVFTLEDLQKTLYSAPGCSCGGPLHIILDDGNLEDTDLEFCRRELDKNTYRYLKSVLALCGAILTLLKALSPAQRHLWWHERYLADLTSKLLALHDSTYWSEHG